MADHLLPLCLAVMLLAGSAPATQARADAPTIAGQSQFVRLEVVPTNIVLSGPRSQQQLVVTGIMADGNRQDLTHTATITSQPAGLVIVEGSVLRPQADGTGHLVISAEGLTLNDPNISLTVSQTAAPAPISFQHELQMALTKAGCNMGACHGSPSGKGGFRLSLRAYDPVLDTLTLRSEFGARRVNLLQPADSLLLKKALMEVSHGGGKRWKKTDITYRVVEAWIAEGMQPSPATEPQLVKIELWPGPRVLYAPAARQQLSVQGFFSDGSQRDLTALADFTSSSDAVAKVDGDGLVLKQMRGETTILARYLDKVATCQLAFLENVPGYVWPETSAQNFVDRRVFEKLQQLQIPPSGLCTDDEFLRRATLDVCGRLPSIEETRQFLAEPNSSKRAALVDRLLGSDQYASFWAMKWSDVLRSNSKKLKVSGVHKFRRWVFDALRQDRPLNAMAADLLTASGSASENPAANYWRASRDPQDATETTAQLFLGVRIQCAKCHNHPFERWTQDNYYGIAAAFARVGRKVTTDSEDEVIYPLESGEITQPRTGQQMKVHLLLTGDVEVPAEVDRRKVFADWLTAPENPFFARSVINRIWGHLLGRGIVEPVDDFRDSNPPSNPRLLEDLARELAANGFSQKWAIRTIMNSTTYQLSSRTTPLNENDDQYFSHATTRLLTAEQLLDAICTVTSVPESFPGMPAGTNATELSEPPVEHDFLKVFGQPAREMACQCERSSDSNLSQALQMINGPVIHGKLRDDSGRIHQMMVAGRTDQEIIETLYLAALSRPPLPDEQLAAQQHLQQISDRRQALEDIGWAVLNSREFLFQH